MRRCKPSAFATIPVPANRLETEELGIRRIAEMLDIGLDAFVFVDDQAFERGEVGETLPEVTVLPATDIPNLLTSPLFDVPATQESTKRTGGGQNARAAGFRVSLGEPYSGYIRAAAP